MSEADLPAKDAFSPQNREYQDPHYHDEEPDVQEDERGQTRRPARMPGRGKNARRLPPRRRYDDD